MTIVIFEDQYWQNFLPLTLTKPLFDIKVGARTFFEEHAFAGSQPDAALVRRHLKNVTAERHYGCKVNEDFEDSDSIFVNGSLHPATLDIPRLSKIKHSFAITSGNRLLAARLSKKSSEYLQKCVELGKPIRIRSLAVEKHTDTKDDAQRNEGLLSDPWDLIRVLENALIVQTAAGPVNAEKPTDISITAPESNLLGAPSAPADTTNPIITDGAIIDDETVLDAENGGIYIAPGTRISQSRIVGPVYIGPQTVVKPFSLIEKSYIGRDCRIAGEIEHSIISDFCNKAHSGFVGHSYLGEWVNLGAMTTTSDLKMTYGNIKMSSKETGLDKLGSFFADMSKTSIGALIYGGRRIGVSSHLHGLVAKDVPSFTILGEGIGTKNVELELESAITTQRKVMPRRGQAITKAYEQMIKDVFSLTSEERRKAKVLRNTKFAI